MNLQFYFEKLLHSQEFRKFKDENKDAYLCFGFFIVDKEKDENKQHFDYYIPSVKKMFSFQVEKDLERVPVEMLDDRIPEKIPDNVEFDFNEIENLLEERMKKENVTNKIQKILLSLQSQNNKLILSGTVFITGLGMIGILIDLENKEIKKFEKKSFFDMMKIIKKDK